MRFDSPLGFPLMLGCAWIVWFELQMSMENVSALPEWEVVRSADTFEKCQGKKTVSGTIPQRMRACSFLTLTSSQL